MSEVAELRALVAKMATDGAKREEAMAAQTAKMQEENTRLITALTTARAGAGGRQPLQVGALPNEAAIRAEKLQKLSLALRKSNKIKDFTDTQTTNIREWLRRFEAELMTLKKMSGINDELQRDEVIECIKDRFDYSVAKRLDTAFAAKEPPLTWAAVTLVELKKVLLEEYDSKETDVSAVLIQFGPNRLRKTADMSVDKFFHLWREQIPECMLPNSEAENARFVDLVKKALFYFCLDDKYLQEQLCELKGDNLTLKMYLDAARVAEQKRKSFQEIGKSSANLDSASGVSISKWEPRNPNSGSANAGRGKSRWYGNKSVKGDGDAAAAAVGRGGGNTRDVTSPKQHAQAPPPAEKTHTTGVQNTHTGARKKELRCYVCKQPGHFANKCPEKLKRHSVKKAELVEGDQKDPEFYFNSFEIVKVESVSTSVNALSTSVSTPYATNKPMMTSVILAGRGKAEFECDTAASHSLISEELYKKLQQEPGCQIPKVVMEKVAMKLADGTISGKLCGSVRLSVQTGNNPSVELSFFVISGPNNLLGRFALESLWPRQYKALRDIVASEASCDNHSKEKDSVGTRSEEKDSGGTREVSQNSVRTVAVSGTGQQQQRLGSGRYDRPGADVSTRASGESEPQGDAVTSGGSETQGHAGNGFTGSAETASDVTTAVVAMQEAGNNPTMPEKRKIPPLPSGDISQEEGEAFCRMICDTYPEVFDGKKGTFRGAEATMFIKPGHMEELMKVGARPPAREPY